MFKIKLLPTRQQPSGWMNKCPYTMAASFEFEEHIFHITTDTLLSSGTPGIVCDWQHKALAISYATEWERRALTDTEQLMIRAYLAWVEEAGPLSRLQEGEEVSKIVGSVSG